MEKVMSLKEYLDNKKELNELRYVKEIAIVVEYDQGYPTYEDAVILSGCLCENYVNALGDNFLMAKVTQTDANSENISITIGLKRRNK